MSKIKLKDGIEFDDTKGINDQTTDVKAYLLPYIDSFNSMNCSKKDKYDRPIKWEASTKEGIKITYERSYKSTDKAKKVNEHTIKLN